MLRNTAHNYHKVIEISHEIFIYLCSYYEKILIKNIVDLSLTLNYRTTKHISSTKYATRCPDWFKLSFDYSHPGDEAGDETSTPSPPFVAYTHTTTSPSCCILFRSCSPLLSYSLSSSFFLALSILSYKPRPTASSAGNQGCDKQTLSIPSHRSIIKL